MGEEERDMIKALYRWFHAATSQSGEAGEYSAGYWQDNIRQAALEMCKDRPGRFLEVGCGEGLFLTKLGLSNPGIQIWGVDNNDRMLDKAWKRLSENALIAVNLQQADAFNLPFGDSWFDTVVCINTLFNMASIDVMKEAFREMDRVCAPGGSIIFDYRNALNALIRLKYKLAPHYDPSVKDLPLTTCRPDEIEPFLKEINFEITLRKSISFPKGKFAPIILLEARKLK